MSADRPEFELRARIVGDSPEEIREALREIGLEIKHGLGGSFGVGDSGRTAHRWNLGRILYGDDE